MPWRDIAAIAVGIGLAIALGLPSLIDGIAALRASFGW